ncbi:hypothetical protein LepocDRAFT_00000100 [Leptothrix ochracea L12]|uniref:Uncharacterized protein n=1 Tax=Leptothrix ochracea L12 TaxID=735332 RepID=I4Z4Z1_9BURK|nr:hypothetical protein LepocDRAFT_00000100 [Leptothrix ochracea L12]
MSNISAGSEDPVDQEKSYSYQPMTAGERKVIFASSLGTVFEWYDFYLYGSLAGIIAKQFFRALIPHRASFLRSWLLRLVLSSVLLEH